MNQEPVWFLPLEHTHGSLMNLWLVHIPFGWKYQRPTSSQLKQKKGFINDPSHVRLFH